MKKLIFFLLIAITLLLLLSSCTRFIEANIIITDWTQPWLLFDNNWGSVTIYYKIVNTGKYRFDYYEVLFKLTCEDGSEYKEWDNEDEVSAGETVNDSKNRRAREQGFKSQYHQIKKTLEKSRLTFGEYYKQLFSENSCLIQNRELSKIMEEFRKKQGLTIYALGDLLEFSHIVTYNYMKGNIFPTSLRLKRIYEIMGIKNNFIL